MNTPNWDFDFLDYPTAWAIQEHGLTHTDPRCSAVQTNGAFLCDCGAVEAIWKRIKTGELPKFDAPPAQPAARAEEGG